MDLRKFMLFCNEFKLIKKESVYDKRQDDSFSPYE